MCLFYRLFLIDLSSIVRSLCLSPSPNFESDRLLGSKVLAAADGIVTKATHSTMRDKRFQCLRNVRIKHTELADGFEIFYCHLGDVLVNFGDTVKRGEVIATIGPCTSCYHHLHFEVTERYIRHDPQAKIAGCFGDETVEPTPAQPLTYPLRC